MKNKKTEPFLWGAATSSHQIEGHNRFNDWWAWEAKGFVEGGVRSGAATDHLHRFREDLKLAKEMGLTSYRFSFEWSRFEPAEDKWDSSAFDWYNELLDACDELGLLPMATLHHFTTPQWLAERGGFSALDAPEKFARYVQRVMGAFGARIPLWCTINEPMVLVAGGYLGRFMPPGRYDPKAASMACYNLLKAHVFAYDLLKAGITKRTGPFKDRPLEVGFAHNMLDFRPERKSHPIEWAMARVCAALYNDAWLKAVSGGPQKFGFPGIFPRAPKLEMARGRRTYDFIGVNYYTKAYVQWRPRTQAKERDPATPIGMSFARRKEKASDLGWAIHPNGFRRILKRVAKYGAPVYITENGIADSADTYRADYLRSHLIELAQAMNDGLDVRGYYHWSLLDNFEWIKGFWPRFGLIGVDYETMTRSFRPSAHVYRDVINAHEGTKAPNVELLTRF
jgi:beta-glucosidase